MAQSLNTKVDLAIPASNFQAFTSYGNIMLGDKAFEYYNQRNPEDNIQIPWDQINYISAEVWFNKWITRFAVFIKGSKRGYFSFSSRDNKLVLRVCREYIGADKLRRSPSFLGSVKRGVQALLHVGPYSKKNKK